MHTKNQTKQCQKDKIKTKTPPALGWWTNSSAVFEAQSHKEVVYK